MNYITLSTSQKKLYRVHVKLLSVREDYEVVEMARNMGLFPHLSDACRVAVRGEVRRRKLTV
ncbi:MAG TPA: hypothetical protein VFT53_07600 [Candidatus Saccharimonadales bacterium]|nr:hypothetical protein [Candidatus Saccharimonadales bacterium]